MWGKPSDPLAAFARLARERPEAAAALPRSLVAGLHPRQRLFADDPSRELAIVCSRRSGKSWAVAEKLAARGMCDPGGLSVYIARSKADARLIIWPDVFERMKEDYGLSVRLFEQDGQLMVALPNGHRIWLAGCKDRSEVSKFRGKKYQTAVVDEAQELPFLEELISESLHHALVDKQGVLILAGTPGPIPAGLFYQATTGDGAPQWPTHAWTIFDNPYIPHAGTEYQRYLARYGLTEDAPKVQREWWGRWVRDDASIVYPYDGERNAWTQELPPGEYIWGLGVDLGYTDATAFVVVAVRRKFPELYVTHAETRTGLIPSAVAAHVDRLQRAHGVAVTVVDEGGLGVGYSEEMRRTYGLAVQPAEKRHKRAYQELLAGDLRSGVVRVNPYTARGLLDEWAILQWLPDRSAEDPRFENHLSDACLYISRALRIHYQPEIEPPSPDSPAGQELERQRLREQAREQVRRRQATWRGGWR